ncbi:MAG: hypothetical protein RBR79_06150 [Bacteroidales bacterium]|jgi:hypothetical protein|nr:hypothetical protein [Bacteroidales bacterium]
MKKKDLVFILISLGVLSLFFIIEPLNNWFMDWSKAKDGRYFILAFIKFAVLATLGESIGLRISKGVYNEKGFGLLPRAIVWGVLGIGISVAMGIFASGAYGFLNYFSLNLSPATLSQEPILIRLIYAFTVSVFMNIIFAPVFMTLHKVTDTHILKNRGTIAGLFTPIEFGNIFTNLNWSVQWNFVFKKTIPFFWIPAHTITFMLPKEFQVLFAALLGVALGVILSFANLKKR